MKPLCGKTLKGAVSSAAFGGVASTIVNLLRVFQNYSYVCKMDKSDCVNALWRAPLIGIATGLGFFIIFFAIRFVLNFFPVCFPVACGHRRWIFTGRSSKTLRDILLLVDETIPTEEKIREFKEEALLYLNDIKTEFEKELPRTFQFIFTGSTTERFGIPVMLSHNRTDRARKALSSIDALNTDLDVMFCPMEDKACFSEEGNILVQPLVADDVGFTGYAKLTSLTPGFEGSCVSSKYIRCQANSAVGKVRVLNIPGERCCYGKCELTPKIEVDSKGPAIKVKMHTFEVDITLCFHCSEWPTLSDWPSRRRNWPSLFDAQRIMSFGCHLVAKPAPSDEDQTSWRFSFSLAEAELSKLVPDTARKCFLALKIILKDHLQPVVPQLGSYHIKTIFFNTLEKLPVTFWVEDNLEECFLTLLAEIRDALLSRNCPHHWFSFVNLFIIDGYLLTLLAKKIQRIIMDPAPFILDDGCCCFSPCCSRVPQYNFTRRTSQPFLDEVIMSVDRERIPRVNHSESHPFQSPFSSSQMHEVPGDLEPCEESTTSHGVVSLLPILPLYSSQMSEVPSDQEPYQETMARPEELVVSLPPVLPIRSFQMPEVSSDPDTYQETTLRPEELVVSLPPVLSTPLSQMPEAPSDPDTYQETQETKVRPEKLVVSLSPVLSTPPSQMPEVPSDPDTYQETTVRPEELVVSLPPVLSTPPSQTPEVQSDSDTYQETTVRPEELVVSLPPIHTTEPRYRPFPDEPYVESFREEITLTVILPPIPDA